MLKQLVLDEIQSGFPLVERPYNELANRLDISEGDVLAAVRALRGEKVIRRIGASFNSKKIGYTSTLCALEVAGDMAEVDRVAAIVNTYPEITHNYLRNNRYNLWFTVIAQNREKVDGVLERIVQDSGCTNALNLPTSCVYKIRVDFGNHKTEDAIDAAGAGRPFDAGSPFDRALVRWAQRDLVGERPFDDGAAYVTAQTGERVNAACVIERLEELKAQGVIRRFGAMVMHRKIGYLFNAMTVWDIDAAHQDDIGQAFAELPFVSHCYARSRNEHWPYSLYGMVHAKTREEMESRIAAMREIAHVEPQVLVSSKEYKKTSPVYFESSDDSGRIA